MSLNGISSFASIPLLMPQKPLVKLITIPKILDECSLVFMQSPHHVPFPIRRVYYILDRKSKLPRGYHAHRKTKQILFCIQGTIKIILDNGINREEVVLKNPEQGVLIDKKIWHEMHNFKKKTILLVLASRHFEVEDYIRDYNQFLEYIKPNEKD